MLRATSSSSLLAKLKPQPIQNLAVPLHSFPHVGQFFVLGCKDDAEHDPDAGIGAGNGTDVYDDELEEKDDDKLGVEAAGIITLVPQCKQNFCAGFNAWLHLVQALGAAIVALGT